jgi:shikimate kinase
MVDIDAEIESRAGMTVSEIFAENGEAMFRSMERAQTLEALEGSPAIVIPGGGWAAQPGNLEDVRGLALTVYLDTSPEVALSRAVPQGGRPLLDDSDPLATMRHLWQQRIGFYESCDVRVKTDGRTPEQVAGAIAELALQRGAG